MTAEKIIGQFQQGQQFEDDGYEDLGMDLQITALEKIAKLDIKDRQKIADMLFPINHAGN